MTLNEQAEPEIYVPTEAAAATAPDGRKLIFFVVPQHELAIKRVLAMRPKEYTYRWAYHAGHKIHVLVCTWPSGEAIGIAIPEGVGDPILHEMLGKTDMYITVETVQDRLKGKVSEQTVQAILLGTTLYLPEVKFKPEA